MKVVAGRLPQKGGWKFTCPPDRKRKGYSAGRKVAPNYLPLKQAWMRIRRHTRSCLQKLVYARDVARMALLERRVWMTTTEHVVEILTEWVHSLAQFMDAEEGQPSLSPESETSTCISKLNMATTPSTDEMDDNTPKWTLPLDICATGGRFYTGCCHRKSSHRTLPSR